MFLSHLSIENFRCFGSDEQRLVLPLRPGLTALVGENDCGKTAIVDAIRLALGTADQEALRVDSTDFCESCKTRQITIACKFEGLTAADKRAFLEYLTHYGNGAEPVLFVTFTAQDLGPVRGRRQNIRIETRSGENGTGPNFANDVKEFLQATYLRPLRDAERAMSSGRGSRLAQVLQHTPEIKSAGVAYDPKAESFDPKALNVLGIGDYANALIKDQKGVVATRGKIDSHLTRLALHGDSIASHVKVSGATASEDIRLRQLLEKLELGLGGTGRLGLGSNNLLFMSCELLLLTEDEAGPKLLLVEEPEAHLHSQRQLRLMKALQEQTKNDNLQVIVTTHSPNLASAIPLDNIVIVRNNRAYPLTQGLTDLAESDYSFLERFLDATKANLFFAKGLMIVEGDAENVLLPTLARGIGRDFTDSGVSIVNVKGTGLGRYARILLRKDKKNPIGLPVACLTDMDVMPDIAPFIIGKLKDKDATWPPLSPRKWRAKKDFADDGKLLEHRLAKEAKATGQTIKTFVSTEWSLEYDLALGQRGPSGEYSLALAEDVFISAECAAQDDAIVDGKKALSNVETEAAAAFQVLLQATPKDADYAETIACKVYARFARDNVSKPIAAQYLAARIAKQLDDQTLTESILRTKLPIYLVNAIDHVTKPAPEPTQPGSKSDASNP